MIFCKFKIVLLLHVVIQTLIYYILTEIIIKSINTVPGGIYHYLCIRKFGRIYDTSGRG